MERRHTALLAGLVLLVVHGCGREPAVTGLREIELAVLEDKIRGGWAGQMIGVSFGAPTEFQYLGRIIPEENLPQWRPEMVRGALEDRKSVV